MTVARPILLLQAAVVSRAQRFDLAVAFALTLVGQLEVFTGYRFAGIGTTAAGPTWIESGIAFAVTASLAFRRRRPITVAVLVAVLLGTQVVLIAPEVSLLSGLVPLLVVVYSVACYARATMRAMALALGLAVQAAFAVRIPEERSAGEVLFSLFVIVGAFLVGDAVGARRRSSELETEALTRRLAEERAARETWAAQVLVEERAAIARELHDVISHGVSVMGVQASAAGVLLGTGRVEDARSAVLAIETQAREAVGELQRLLGVLREQDAEGSLGPQPGLGQLADLVGQVSRAGLPVTLALKGGSDLVSAGVSMTAYRVVQEALTNVIKHAARAPTEVAVDCAGGAVLVSVRNDGPPLGRSPIPGHGLIGMRERVEIYGGSLRVETPSTGGLAVFASIPFQAVV